ncbi:hypothetical protein ACLUUI_14455 [Enterobacterales bacterium AW_CKDN230030176-1A_HGKHYDSX7]
MATKKAVAEETPSTTAEPAPAPAVVFRDTVYTSRVLILPDSLRGLPVRAQRVSVPADDDEALAYLDAHPDLVREE